MMTSVLYSMLPRISPVDRRAQLHRALLGRYLAGPLPALADVFGAPCGISVDPAPRLPSAAAWWSTESGALIGLPPASLDGLFIFHNRPALPSGPDDLFARLAVDRPLVFSRAQPMTRPSSLEPTALAGWIRSPGLALQFVFQPAPGPDIPDYPISPPAMDFPFLCSFSIGFLPVSTVAGAKQNEVIFPGWPAKDSGFLGRHDLWIPVRHERGQYVACGGWFMKPSPIDHFPLEISVELGRIRLRGGELAALTRGAVLPLGNSFGGQVHLVYDNRLLARAELVVAGGEMAIRLLTDVPALDEPTLGSNDSQQGENP